MGKTVSFRVSKRVKFKIICIFQNKSRIYIEFHKDYELFVVISEPCKYKTHDYDVDELKTSDCNHAFFGFFIIL